MDNQSQFLIVASFITWTIAWFCYQSMNLPERKKELSLFDLFFMFITRSPDLG